ncbi:MAG: MarR family transcriptional regulator [Candidatus Bathyarchaeia archaeon]|jgi:DNA-binding MarR family transcriptional regulator
MVVTPQESARELLEVVPTVMRDIRSEMRSRRSPELTVPQFRTLAFVNRKEGPSLSEVADHMGLTPPSTCRLVDGLIARGMMTRQGHPTDRRRVRLTVTPRGHRVLEASRRGALAYLADKLDGVTADDRAVIVKAMEVLRSVFTTDTRARAVVK